jgi:uncharacterized protein
MPTGSPSTSPADGPTVLVAAQSGRALAAAARRAGFAPLVADLFGDSDTRALAAAYRRLRGRFGLGLEEGGVLSALDSLARSAPTTPLGVVLGSGFERRPHLIAAIDRRFRVIGTSAESVVALKDPAGFAGLLRRLGVPHPPISMRPVPNPSAWLRKARGGSGGAHIRLGRAGPPPRGTYLQARVEGSPRSLAFLADGRKARVLAATGQWTAPSDRAPCRYGGAVEPGSLPLPVREAAEAAVQGIVRATGLRGLASADLLVDGERWWLLEINPRPGATLDLLDRRRTPLFLRHVAASGGDLGPDEPAPAGACGTAIVYAARAIPCVPSLDWPDFVADRPNGGARIPAGAPICTVAATAGTAAAVRRLLAERAAAIIANVGGEEVHDAAHGPIGRSAGRPARHRAEARG